MFFHPLVFLFEKQILSLRKTLEKKAKAFLHSFFGGWVVGEQGPMIQQAYPGTQSAA